MRIVQITPGSGDNFYCENCLRDLALVTSHFITVIPAQAGIQKFVCYSKNRKIGKLVRNLLFEFEEITSFFSISLRLWHAAGRSPLSQIVDFGFLKS